MIYDYCVIGGGIVGLATALSLSSRQPDAAIIILEKEDGLARHQTGHNSGVIHAGIYYQPGSLKARLCKEGAVATKAFCERHDIPFETCGKLLVATNPVELERMSALEVRAQQNGIGYTRLSKEELSEAEPYVAGIGALRVSTTAIVSYRAVCDAMARDLRARGVDIRLGAKVTAIAEGADLVTVSVGDDAITARHLVACCGLQSDRIARMAGLETDFRIIPFRGEYYTLPSIWADRVKHLIYPIPDPDLPFLGIHLTRMIDGSVTVGPNAVLGMAREGYPKLSFDASDVAAIASFPGFWKMAAANIRSGISELLNSAFRSRYLEECRKYCPDLALDELRDPAAGIRAQGVMRDGALVHDFLFRQSRRTLHVCNAPSPAATSAIPIGSMIVDRLLNA